MFKYAVFFIFLFSSHTKALVGTGGYVPFGLSTQKDDDGSRRTFSFEPYIFINTVIQAPYNHVFLPEFGYVFHTSTQYDDYDKSTMFLLADLGYKLTPNLILRYGLGVFRTSVGSDGGAVTLQNGSGTATFYKPSDSVTSYNTTWNLGIENSININYALRFQFYLFEPLSSKRDLSYSLALAYYL